MNKKNLLWIIPLCILIFGSIGYIKGTLDGANLMVDECNSQYEYQITLCDLECELHSSILNTLEYYEKRCPNVGMDISTMSNDEMLIELNKYGIDNRG